MAGQETPHTHAHLCRPHTEPSEPNLTPGCSGPDLWGRLWPLRAPTVSSGKWGYCFTLQVSSCETRGGLHGVGIITPFHSNLGPKDTKVPHHTQARGGPTSAKTGHRGTGAVGAGGQHPCPGSFVHCAPPCVQVPSDLLQDTLAHTDEHPQPRVNSNMDFDKQMFSFYKTLVPHSTVDRVQSCQGGRWSRAGEGLGWPEKLAQRARAAHQGLHPCPAWAPRPPSPQRAGPWESTSPRQGGNSPMKSWAWHVHGPVGREAGGAGRTCPEGRGTPWA